MQSSGGWEMAGEWGMGKLREVEVVVVVALSLSQADEGSASTHTAVAPSTLYTHLV